MASNSFREALDKLWPRAKPNVRKAIADTADSVFAEHGVTTPLRIAHIMAQISHECGGGTIGRENMNYRAERIMEIFGFNKKKGKWVHSAKVSDAEAYELAGNPQALAERVYGLGNPKKAAELGNTRPGDGFKFRGNGFGQLTGRGAHRRLGQKYGIDLENHPELLEDPRISFRVAVAEYVGNGVLPYADKDNITMVTRKVNGGTNGLADRQVWLRRWKAELPGLDEPAWVPRGAMEDNPEGFHKSILQSKILQGAAGTAASAAVSAGAKVAQNGDVEAKEVPTRDIAETVQNVQTKVSDAVTTVTTVRETGTAIVEVARPVLGVSPTIWSYVGIAATTLCLILIAYTIWQRVKKWQDQGV